MTADSAKVVAKYLRSLLLISTVLSSISLAVGSGQSIVNQVQQTPPLVDYVVLIVMENQNINQTYKCGMACSWLTPFADNNSLAINYHGVVNGSLPNYFALTMGQINKNGDDCSPNPASKYYCPQNYSNIVDRLEAAGRTWKAYVEEYPGSGVGPLYSSGGCFVGWGNGAGDNSYAGDHNPFVYYTDIVGNRGRCDRIVSANSLTTPVGPESDDVLLADLNNLALTAPNYMWLTPNDCDQMHHLCSWPGVTNMVTQGSMYLSNLVPQILNSFLFRTQRAVLMITFDECQNVTTNTCLNTNHVYNVWASNPSTTIIKQNFKSNNYYDHYSLLHTLETVWGLKSLTSNDSSAASMNEFFDPPVSSFSGGGGGGRSPLRT